MYPANSKLPKGWAKPMKDKTNIDVYDVINTNDLTLDQVVSLFSEFLQNPEAPRFYREIGIEMIYIASIELAKNCEASDCGALWIGIVIDNLKTGDLSEFVLHFEQDNWHEGFTLDEIKPTALVGVIGRRV